MASFGRELESEKRPTLHTRSTLVDDVSSVVPARRERSIARECLQSVEFDTSPRANGERNSKSDDIARGSAPLQAGGHQALVEHDQAHRLIPARRFRISLKLIRSSADNSSTPRQRARP